MRLLSWDCFSFKTMVVALLCCAGPQAGVAGGIEAHLVATNVIATQLGYGAGAWQVARANWSTDLTRKGEALPNVRDVLHLAGSAAARRGPFGALLASYFPDDWWYTRGAMRHTLAASNNVIEDIFSPSKDAAHAGLVRLRDDALMIIDSAAPEDAKLAALGQYLHATQDAYFHQDKDGNPFGHIFGHAFQSGGGHDVDRVAANFKNALRANQATHDILKHYRTYKTLPDVKPVNKIYSTITERTAQANEIRDNDFNTGIYTLTKDISDTYRKVEISDPPQDRQTIYYDPSASDLKKKLAGTWRKIPHDASAAWSPSDFMFELGVDSKYDNYKIDYDGPDSKLLLQSDPDQVPWPAAPFSVSRVAGGQIAAPQRTQTVVAGRTPAVQTPALAAAPPGQASKITGRTLPGAPPVPGGISLSMAAASRLAVKVDLDGLYASQGRMVLSGRSDGERQVDAALFYTAVRLACEPNDPFFSLDPDDGMLWTKEGRSAADVLWKRINSDYNFDEPLKSGAQEGLIVRTLSAKRDYSQLWATMAPQYPNFKTRLVFRPDWLRTTRFGEIMYKADVLLKELDSGIPMLQPNTSVRASKVDGYVSNISRSATESLLSIVESGKRSGPPEFKGTRLWFDLAPKADDQPISMLDSDPRNPSVRAAPSTDPVAVKLRATLVARGFVDAPVGSEPARKLAVDGDAVDLSQVYPKIFVRAHDNATGKDIDGASPEVHAISDDVNRRIKQYVGAYEELRALTEAFRLYVAAVAFTQRDPRICPSVKAVPLLNSEKIRMALPEFHPSELYFTFATYTLTTGGQKRWWLGSSSSRDGGVSPRAKEFYEKAAARSESTAVTAEVRREAINTDEKAAWLGASGRSYLALDPNVEPGFVRYIERLQSLKPDTHEMLLAQLGISTPTATRGTGLLDDIDTVAGPSGGGMLDDVDPSRGGIVVIPGRR